MTKLIFIIGTIASTVGIVNIGNYYHPYWFGFIFGGIGLLVGVLVSMNIAAERKPKDKMLYMSICILFFGLFLMAASFINQGLSRLDKFDKYQVINKYKTRARNGYRHTLIVDIDGKSHKLVCDKELWHNTSSSVYLFLRKGRLGFDYISFMK